MTLSTDVHVFMTGLLPTLFQPLIPIKYNKPTRLHCMEKLKEPTRLKWGICLVLIIKAISQITSLPFHSTRVKHCQINKNIRTKLPPFLLLTKGIIPHSFGSEFINEICSLTCVTFQDNFSCFIIISFQHWWLDN